MDHTTTDTASHTRRVSLSRDGSQLRLSFAYSQDLVEKVRTLPYAHFDATSRSWGVQLCSQSVDQLRRWYYEGLCDVSVDDLLTAGETVTACAEAVLRKGSNRRPYLVQLAWRDDKLYNRFAGVPGARWERNAGAFSYPPMAAAALAEAVANHTLDDPDRLLGAAAILLLYDNRAGSFTVRCDDERAQAAFEAYFPRHDVITLWQQQGLDVAFADTFTREMYRGELARNGAGTDVAGMRLPLYPYQRLDVAVGVERSGLAVLSSPGVGKTVSAIAIGLERLNRNQVNRVVCVVPGHLRSQWGDEIVRFTGDTPTVVLGDKAAREEAWAEAQHSRWVVVHYEILHRDIAHLTPLVGDALLVADEAHRIANPDAKRTKLMRDLGRKAPYRIALSGTPLQNDPGEWFSLLSGFVVPGVLGTPGEYFGRYAYPGRFGGWEGARNLDELHRRSAPLYLRRTKDQVADHLPPLRIEHLALDVDDAYHTLLSRVHRQARDEIAQAARDRVARSRRANGVLDGQLMDEADQSADMTATMMLRMLCTSPRLVQASQRPGPRALVDAGLVPDVDGPKMEELRRLVGDLATSGERVVIFTSFKTMAQLIHDRLGEDGVTSVLFTGDTSHKDREAARLAFTTADEGSAGPVAFISTDAGSEGLNLGRQCSTLINVDVPWTASKLEQRANRIHRIDGTHASYRVINMTLKGTVEDGILKLVEHKADLADAVLGEAGGRGRATGRNAKVDLDALLGDPLLAAVYAAADGDVDTF
jgi:superfamily II DNA or RNA helicase